ncbi:5'-nucleotidase C-terminal domain-containing protein [Tateyamaria sp.]|uniref:5'-nucleotidase C-terminal domain-containing protein n=1 Tax=Tateyamaria sp. TaxID=1929288 RepID=UPI00329C2C8B
MVPNVCAIGHRFVGAASHGLAFTLPISAFDVMGSPQTISDLRILATSDVHMHITGWNPLQNDTSADRGMDMLAHRIDAARRDAPGACVLLDNGDSLHGTSVGTTCATWPEHTIHPWPALLNALDYDAVGLGNHDFDFGVPFLENVVAQTRAPTLCAGFASGSIENVAATTIVHRAVTCADGTKRDLNIGITSVLPPQTALWNYRHLSGLIRFEEGVTAAQKAVVQLKQDGADVVIVLCHSGISAFNGNESENFAAVLAQEIKGIDALIMGHTHQLFPLPDGPQTVHGVPAVMPGFGAEALGVIDLRIKWDSHGWHVAQHKAALHTICPKDTPRPDIIDLAAPAIAATNTALDVELAQTETGFHSYFGMLQSDVSGAMIARAMTCCIAGQVAGTALSEYPLIASVSPAALGGRAGPRNYIEVEPGIVRARHIATLIPHPNTVWAVTMQGADLWRWAERSAGYFAPEKCAQSRLVDPNVPSYNFDTLHGLETVIDPFQPAKYDPFGRLIDPKAKRVLSLTYQGRPVDPKQPFLLAVTSYRGAGGGGFPGLPGDPHVLRTDIDLFSAVCDDVARDPMPAAPTRSAWRFADAGRTRVTIETSPNARAHLHDIARFDPKVIKVNDAGFLELSVVL